MRKNTIEIPGKGQTTVTAGGVGLGKKATWDLTHLSTADPSGGEGGTTFGYNYELRVRFDGNLLNGNVASKTVEARKLPDALVKNLRLNANGHLFFDLADMGGRDLVKIDEIQSGLVPPYGDDYVVPGSGTNGGILGFTYQFTLRFFEPRLKKPTDKLVPLKLLQKAILELKSSVDGELGADVTIDSYSITVTAHVVERDHYRQPALWSWIEKRQSSNDDFLSPAEVQYQDIFVVQMWAEGLTEDTFATDGSDVSSVTLKINADQYVEEIAPQDLIGQYNAQNPRESAAYIPDPSAGTDMIPIFWLSRQDGLMTKNVYAENAPKLKLAGDADFSDGYRVLEHIQIEHTTEDFARHAVRGGVTIPKGSVVRSKTQDKVPVQKGYEHHGSFLPAELITPGE